MSTDDLNKPEPEEEPQQPRLSTSNRRLAMTMLCVLLSYIGLRMMGVIWDAIDDGDSAAFNFVIITLGLCAWTSGIMLILRTWSPNKLLDYIAELKDYHSRKLRTVQAERDELEARYIELSGKYTLLELTGTDGRGASATASTPPAYMPPEAGRVKPDKPVADGDAMNL